MHDISTNICMCMGRQHDCKCWLVEINVSIGLPLHVKGPIKQEILVVLSVISWKHAYDVGYIYLYLSWRMSIRHRKCASATSRYSISYSWSWTFGWVVSLPCKHSYEHLLLPPALFVTNREIMVRTSHTARIPELLCSNTWTMSYFRHESWILLQVSVSRDNTYTLSYWQSCWLSVS